MADRVGQQLGNYRLTRLLARGGFAEVYLGEHIHLDSLATIKVLHTELTSAEVEKFRAEGRTLVRLIHPRIVRLLDFGIQDTTPFLVMDYAPNGSLRQRHPIGDLLPFPTIVSYVKQVAEALQYAHDQKLIHRDIKPENMLLGRSNEVLLADFGLAVVVDKSSRSQATQELAGTMAYMAPEQIQGRPRLASDQYALGVVVYEWLSGDVPFHGPLHQVMYQQMNESPPLLREKVPTISIEVERVVLRALAKDSQNRYSSVQEFAAALEQASLSGQSPRSAPTIVAPSPRKAPPAPQKTKEQWIDEGIALRDLKRYEEAIAAYDQAIRLDPNYATAYINKGNALNNLKRSEEAIAAYDQAIRLNPNYATAYNDKGNALYDLKRSEEAIAAYDQAIRLDPNYANAYNNKGAALERLGRKAEAQQARQKARELGYSG